MHHGVAAAIALTLASLAGGTACAMTAEAAGFECRVTGGEKLPAETSVDVICAKIGEALAAAKPRSPVKVEVRVTSQSSLTARIEVGGKRLPDEELAVMDRKLSNGSVEMLARRIAEVASKAAEQG